MKKILFVCTGNTCRSPMAEIILKNKIKLSGIKGIRVSSAGLSAVEGDKISKNSSLALKRLGYVVRGFKSKRINVKLILDCDLIICMTGEHKFYLQQYPNVCTVSEITGGNEISDPYGKGIDEYIKVSCELEDACNIILDRLLKGELI